MRARPNITPQAPVTPPPVTWRGRAFTLIELLVVIAIIGVLLALLLPAYNLAKVRIQRGVCAAHLRELAMAWQLWADDNRQDLVNNQPLLAGGVPNPDSWFSGSARLEHDVMYGPAPFYTSTNRALARASKLYPYLNTIEPFRCPSDQRALDTHRVVRSYSLNCWMNGQSMGDPSGYVSMANDNRAYDDLLKFRFFRKLTQVDSPSDVFVFMEESEVTLSDSMFAAVKDLTTMRDLADLPGSRHDRWAVMTYADGHANFFRVAKPSRLATLSSVQSIEDLQEKDLKLVGEMATTQR